MERPLDSYCHLYPMIFKIEQNEAINLVINSTQGEKKALLAKNEGYGKGKSRFQNW
jgi:hypothetical protein